MQVSNYSPATQTRPDWIRHLDNAPPEKKNLTPQGATPEYFNAPRVRNNALETYAQDHYKPIKTPDEITAVQVRAQIKQRFGVDVDPDKTFLVTIAYDHRNDNPPYKGVIYQKISLTEAARLNIQGVELPSGAAQRAVRPYKDGKPPFTLLGSSRHGEQPGATGIFPLPDISGLNTYYQGIYTEPSASSPDTYDANNQLSIAPEDFQKMVWDNAYKKPYDDYLKFYWEHNGTRASYTGLSKAAYLKAAHAGHHDQSLNENDRKIAMGAAGMPTDSTYLELDASDMKQPYKRDPNLETRFLSFSGFDSVNIFYTRDKTTQRTLLYMPGNVPPMLGFDSPVAMNRWLGEQLKDPQKAAAFKLHFRPQDRDNDLGSAGVDARVDLIHNVLTDKGSSAKPEKQGYWKEGGVFDGKVVQGDPFEEIQQRSEQAMKNGTDNAFVLNTDVTKNTIVKGLRVLSWSLLFLAPLGIALPPVGLLMTGIAITRGAVELGIGIDDKITRRPGADERITQGAINTFKPLLTEGFGNAFGPVLPSANFIKKLILKRW